MLGFFLVQHRVAEAKQSLWTFVHLQNFFGTPFEHVWSLGVEEHFYTLVAIIFAVAVYRKAAMDFNSITKIVAGIGVLALASRILAVVHWDDAYWWLKMGTHQRMDALAFGVWISAAYHLKQELFERISSYRVLLWILVVVGLLPLLFFQHQSGFVYTVGFDFLSVSYCSLLILFISAPRFDGGLHAFLQGRFAGWIARIGFYSYGIYLWHWSASQKPTYFLIEKLGYYRHFGPSIGWVLATVTYCGLAIVAGVVTTKVIEIPTLKLRDRLFPTKATNPALM